MLFLKNMMEANPFQDPLRFERRVPPCAIVIFGANGDLTKRKLIPALYRLAYDRRIPPGFAVIGNSRTPMTNDQFRAKMRAALKQFLDTHPIHEDLWADFSKSLSYYAGDLNDPTCFDLLGKKLQEIEQTRKTEGNVLFYVSTQPSHYGAAINGIGAANLAHGSGWRRVV